VFNPSTFALAQKQERVNIKLGLLFVKVLNFFQEGKLKILELLLLPLRSCAAARAGVSQQLAYACSY
jgi:hypothetical protein